MTASGLISYSCALAIAAIIPGPQIFAIGNPKSVLFYVSIMPSIVDLRSITAADALVLLGLTGTILMAAQLPFALAAARTRRLFRSPRRLRLMNRSAASCMGGTAAAIALRK